MVLRSILSYAAASRALSGGPTAFESSTKFLVGNMLKSMARKLEIELLYGQQGYGTVSAIDGGRTTITVTTAQWAPGIWAGAEGMPIVFSNAAMNASRTGTYNVVSVDMDARTVTVDAALDAGVIATDVIHHFGAFVSGSSNEFAGIHKILTNTSSLFNINAGTYNLWKGVEYSAASAALSFTKILAAVARAVEKGLDQDIKLLVNPRTWANLVDSETARRRYDGSYKPGEFEQGANSIKFHGQNGMIEVEPSIYVKEGFAYGLVMDELVRVGSSDVTFKRPGQGDEFFRDLENSAGYELRAYCDQAVFCAKPGIQILIKNIVNS